MSTDLRALTLKAVKAVQATRCHSIYDAAKRLQRLHPVSSADEMVALQRGMMVLYRELITAIAQGDDSKEVLHAAACCNELLDAISRLAFLGLKHEED